MPLLCWYPIEAFHLTHSKGLNSSHGCSVLHGLQVTPCDFCGLLICLRELLIWSSLLPCSFCSSHISFIPSINIYQYHQVPGIILNNRATAVSKFSCHVELMLAFFFLICTSTYSLCLLLPLPGKLFSCMTWFFTSFRNANLLERPDHPTQESDLCFPLTSLECKRHEDKDLVCPVILMF